MIRTATALALATLVVAPAAGAATSASCPWGPQIGTACVRDPRDVALDTACPILEGQTVVGLKCAPHDVATAEAAASSTVWHTACVVLRDNTGINMACEG